MKVIDTCIMVSLTVLILVLMLGTLSWLGENTPKMRAGIESCVIEGCNL